MCWILIQFEHFERLCQVEPSYWSSSIAGIAFGSTRFILWSLALSPCRPPLRPNHVSAHRCSTLLHAANPSKFALVPVHARARSTVALPHPCKRGRARALTHAKFREVPRPSGGTGREAEGTKLRLDALLHGRRVEWAACLALQGRHAGPALRGVALAPTRQSAPRRGSGADDTDPCRAARRRYRPVQGSAEMPFMPFRNRESLLRQQRAAAGRPKAREAPARGR